MGDSRIRLTILIAVFACTGLGVRAATRYHAAQSQQPDWRVVPYKLDGWAGVDGQFDPLYGTDPADTSLLRVYSRASQPPVIAYVGFFSNFAAIMEVHTPELCYPAQGWSIVSSQKSAAQVYRGAEIRPQEIVVDKGSERRLVMWWYNAGSRPFENRIRYTYALLALSTINGRSDGSMVRLETPFVPNGEAAARIRMQEFRKSLLPWLDQALPR